MSMQTLFGSYDEYTSAAELSASRGRSLAGVRDTTTPTPVLVSDISDGAYEVASNPTVMGA